MFLSTSVTSVKTKVHKSLKAFARTFKEAFSDAAYGLRRHCSLLQHFGPPG